MKEYGRKPYISISYIEMMKTTPNKDVWTRIKEAHSEFEKPYVSDDYTEMQYLHPTAPGITPGLPTEFDFESGFDPYDPSVAETITIVWKCWGDEPCYCDGTKRCFNIGCTFPILHAEPRFSTQCQGMEISIENNQLCLETDYGADPFPCDIRITMQIPPNNLGYPVGATGEYTFINIDECDESWKEDRCAVWWKIKLTVDGGVSIDHTNMFGIYISDYDSVNNIVAAIEGGTDYLSEYWTQDGDIWYYDDIDDHVNDPYQGWYDTNTGYFYLRQDLSIHPYDARGFHIYSYGIYNETLWTQYPYKYKAVDQGSATDLQQPGAFEHPAAFTVNHPYWKEQGAPTYVPPGFRTSGSEDYHKIDNTVVQSRTLQTSIPYKIGYPLSSGVYIPYNSSDEQICPPIPDTDITFVSTDSIVDLTNATAPGSNTWYYSDWINPPASIATVITKSITTTNNKLTGYEDCETEDPETLDYVIEDQIGVHYINFIYAEGEF